MYIYIYVYIYIYIYIYIFIHLVVCLTTGPNPLPKRALHLVRFRNSSFKWEYPLLSLRSSSSFLRLLPCPPVTSIPPFIFHSITRFRKQFLRIKWPIQLAFRLLISCRIFLCSLTLSNTFLHFSHDRSKSSSPSFSSTTLQNFPDVYIYIYIYIETFIPISKQHILVRAGYHSSNSSAVPGIYPQLITRLPPWHSIGSGDPSVTP